MGQFEIGIVASAWKSPQNKGMDVNTLAKLIVDKATGEKPVRNPNPEAAKRGNARAASLTNEKRASIARKAAKARWQDKS